MATFTEILEPSVVALLGQARESWHKRLDEPPRVTITLLWAYAPKDDGGEPKGHAITDGGMPCCCEVKITSLKERAAGLADVLLILDGDTWKEHGAQRQLAIMDSALARIVHAKKHVQLDDCGRPKLKIRKPDAQVKVMYDVIERHGDAAVEAEAVSKIVQTVSESQPGLFKITAHGWG